MAHKEIKVDASDNPALARKVFSVAVGATPLPDDLGKGLETDTTPKQFLQGHSTVPRFVTQKKLPEWNEFSEKVFKFSGNEDRAEFAAQAIKDGRIKPDQHGGYVIDHGSDEAIRQFIAWAEADPTKIENPQGSVWHKLAAAYQADRVVTARGNNIHAVDSRHDAFLAADPQVFLIQHNWAAAFAGAKDFAEGDAPFPFEHCAFELSVSGRRVIMVTRDVGGAVPSAAIYVDINGAMWIGSKIAPFGEFQTFTDRSSKFNRAVHDSIRALCIALDAEVAVTEVIRAPHRLNHQREKQGKKPILDHHVINLARRSRVEALPSAGDHEAKWHPRLHFRRGHWRHFENHKTWVRWCLVGDPDLGFIDKEYRA